MDNAIRIRNLRSLESIDLELRPLTVLVGPNGSGKSNILSAFQLLQEYASKGQTLLSELGQDSSLFWDGGSKGHGTISIELEGVVADAAGAEREFRYTWEVTRTPQGWVNLTRERFAYTDVEPERVLLEYPIQTGLAQIYREDGNTTIGLGPGGQSFLSIAAQQFEESGLRTFARQVISWEFIGTAPSYARKAQKAIRELRLSSGGENLSAVLHSIYAEDQQAFIHIVDALKAAVPALRSVSTPITEAGDTYVATVEEGVRTRLPIWALSDGTISLLTLFTALEQPERPTLIGIEEPENFLHPGVLENLLASMRRATKTSQLIVSTHSPYLVNLLKPEDIVVVEKESGKTRARYADAVKGVGEATKNLALGELWVSGGIGGVP